MVSAGQIPRVIANVVLSVELAVFWHFVRSHVFQRFTIFVCCLLFVVVIVVVLVVVVVVVVVVVFLCLEALARAGEARDKARAYHCLFSSSAIECCCYCLFTLVVIECCC